MAETVFFRSSGRSCTCNQDLVYLSGIKWQILYCSGTGCHFQTSALEGFHYRAVQSTAAKYSTVPGAVQETRPLIVSDPGEMRTVLFSTVCSVLYWKLRRMGKFRLGCSDNPHLGGSLILSWMQCKWCPMSEFHFQ